MIFFAVSLTVLLTVYKKQFKETIMNNDIALKNESSLTAVSCIEAFLENNFMAMLNKSVADANETKHSMESICRMFCTSKKRAKMSKHRLNKIEHWTNELTKRQAEMGRVRNSVWEIVENPKSTKYDIKRAINSVIRSADHLLTGVDAAKNTYK